VALALSLSWTTVVAGVAVFVVGVALFALRPWRRDERG
jgi:hypothetical protein